jgi:hypothetical protein
VTAKPAAVAYINASFLITDSDEARVRKDVARFAADWGYDLIEVHIEEHATAPDAFTWLVRQVTAMDITTVIVPGLHHFAAIGSPVEVKDRLEHLIGGWVIPATFP